MVVTLKFHNGLGGKFHNGAQIKYHEVVEVVGGASGGRSKQVGVPLGERPWNRITALSISKIIIKSEAQSKSKLRIPIKFESICRIIPVMKGMSISKLIIKQEAKSESKTVLKTKLESISTLNLQERIVKEIKKFEKVKKLMKLTTLVNMAESIDKEYSTQKSYEFSFSEEVHDEALKAFTHSSSFVGNAQFNPAEGKMRLLLNERVYFYCGLSERDFDAFRGSPSKGAHFNRHIKDVFSLC